MKARSDDPAAGPLVNWIKLPGPRFLWSANAQPGVERRAAFLTGSARKYKVNKIPVPMAAAQGCDAVYILLYLLFGIRDGNLSESDLIAAMETTQPEYYGVVAIYELPFTVADKDAITPNMLVTGTVKNGVVTFACPQDAKRNLFVQRKQYAFYLGAANVSRSSWAFSALKGPSTRASTSPCRLKITA